MWKDKPLLRLPLAQYTKTTKKAKQDECPGGHTRACVLVVTPSHPILPASTAVAQHTPVVGSSKSGAETTAVLEQGMGEGAPELFGEQPECHRGRDQSPATNCRTPPR